MKDERLKKTKDETSQERKDYSKSFIIIGISFVTLILYYIKIIQGISFMCVKM